MKKILPVIIILLLALESNAQFTLGPKIGYTATSLSTDHSDISTSLSNSAVFGAFARFGKRFYVQPEINWYTVGTVFTPVNIGSWRPFEQEVTVSNIQVPLYFGVKLINMRFLKLRAMAGPTANFVIDKSVSTSKFNNFLSPIKEKDINDIHWGAQFGLGIDVFIITLDVHFIVGVSNLIDDIEIMGQNIALDSKNHGVVVSAGIKLF